MIPKKVWGNVASIFAILGLVFSLLSGAAAVHAEQDGSVDLAITMTAPQHVAPGSTFVVNVSYSNIGTLLSAEDTWLSVVLADGTSFDSATNLYGEELPLPAVDGSKLTWSVGPLAGSDCSGHILLTLQVADDLAEAVELTTQAQIGSSSTEVNLDNNIASVTSAVCEMAGSTKQVDKAQAKPGDVLMYTITLRLQARVGQKEAPAEREITLTDELPLPGQIRFMGWVGENAGTYDGLRLHWQGVVREGEPLVLQYRLGIEGDVPAGSIVRNGVRLAWTGGEIDLDPVDVTVYLTENDHMFGSQGGQWQHQSGLKLDVPPNAVQATTRFEYHPLFEDTPPADLPASWQFAHHSFEMTAFQFGELHQFNQPLTITIPYTNGDIAGMLPTTLRLWYRAGLDEPWQMLGEPQMHQNGQISFITDHFTEFVLLGQPAYRLTLPIIIR